MRAYAVIVMELEGDKTVEFVTAGKYALLKRMMYSAAEAASAVVRVAPGAQWTECIWMDDAPEDKLEDWQTGLMQAVEEREAE